MKQNPRISRVQKVDRQHHHEWKETQNPPGQPSLCGMNFDLSFNAKTLSDYKDQSVQDFGQVPAGVLLYQNAGDQYLQIRRWYSIEHLHQGFTQRQSVVVLFESSVKLSFCRFFCVFSNNFKRGDNGVTCPQSTRAGFYAVGQDIIKCL